MAALYLNIQSGNAAFSHGHAPLEMVRILRDLADRIETLGSLDLNLPLSDINGNKVGLCYASEGADDD
jgi:hypothetical protein